MPMLSAMPATTTTGGRCLRPRTAIGTPAGTRGTGATGYLADGDVHGWKYNNIDGFTGATSGWLAPNYDHFADVSGIADINIGYSTPAIYYRMDGTQATGDLIPGIYIKKQGDKTTKILIR